MRPVYISATVQDSGKTSLSLGLMQVLGERGVRPGYIKPVGQHYVQYMGRSVDEDAALVHQLFGFEEDPHCLSPIAIKRGFTASFIEDPDVGPLERSILDCVGTLRESYRSLLVEGTGHAGVGSCFGLSNARVAQLLGAKVVIVTGGGIGRPIDEVAVSLSLFREHDVEVIGVVLNKVLPAKADKIRAVVGKGLPLIGTELLGAIPYEPSLTHFTVGQLADEFGYELVCGGGGLTNRIEHTLIAAMEPQNFVPYIREHTLIIAPADRLDNILVSILVLSEDFARTGGLILTGGIDLHPTVMPLLEKSGIPILKSADDTFTVSSRMADLCFKIRLCDGDKIGCLRGLVREHVDIERILGALEDT